MKVTYKNNGKERKSATMTLIDAEKYVKMLEAIDMSDIKIVEE